MLAILFQGKTNKNARFPKKNAEKNASTIEKGLAAAGAYEVPMVEPWEKCKCLTYGIV